MPRPSDLSFRSDHIGLLAEVIPGIDDIGVDRFAETLDFPIAGNLDVLPAAMVAAVFPEIIHLGRVFEQGEFPGPVQGFHPAGSRPVTGCCL
jgi:hypothetical protein